MKVLVLAEVEEGRPAEASLEAITALRELGPVDVVVVDGGGADLSGLGAFGAQRIHRVTFDGYAPQAWGAAVAQLAAASGAELVGAAATERGNEVLAHAAVDLQAPFAANCVTVDPAGPVRRIRWGGSLLEDARIGGPVRVVSTALHRTEAAPAPTTAPGEIVEATVTFDDAAVAVRVVDQEKAAEGITLATAKVVVSGGRGVGSAEGFAPLEELAELLGGRVGCSRVVTNNGWRPHSDQVGQTGTVVAPDLYIACGISGAIQHWVGMMAAKKVLAINTDRDAPMVTKADYAVVGDLHEVLPAVIAELRSRT